MAPREASRRAGEDQRERLLRVLAAATFLIFFQVTGCKFSVAQMLCSSAQIEGNRIRRERCAKKKVWDSELVLDTDMRVSAMFSDPCAADALTARGSVFSHAFKGLE